MATISNEELVGKAAQDYSDINAQLPARVVKIEDSDGRVWYRASDVAELLGFEDPSEAVRAHCLYTSVGLYSNQSRSGVFIMDDDVQRLAAARRPQDSARVDKAMEVIAISPVERSSSLRRHSHVACSL